MYKASIHIKKEKVTYQPHVIKKNIPKLTKLDNKKTNPIA